MSRFQFESPTKEEAIAFLKQRREGGTCQAEGYHDAIRCQRRLLPVASPGEIEASRQYNQQYNRERTMAVTITCKCGNGATFKNDEAATSAGYYYDERAGWICTACNPEFGKQTELPFAVRALTTADKTELEEYFRA